MRCASPPDSVPDAPVEAEVAEPDLDERRRRSAAATPAAAPPTARRRRGPIRRGRRSAARETSAMLIAVDPRRSRRLAEPGAVAVGAGGEHHRLLHEGADVGLHRVDVLGEHRLLDLRDQALVGQVDPLDLDLGRLLVEQVVELALVELLDRLVRIEVAAAAEDPAEPAVHAVAGDRERTLVERLAVVVERGQVEVADRPDALAARAHAADAAEARALGDGLVAALDRDPHRSRGQRRR